MKKILKTAFATFFTLIMCLSISAGGHKTKIPHAHERPSYAKKGLPRWRQLSRAQKEREKQQLLMNAKAELERVKKELKRVRGETDTLSELMNAKTELERVKKELERVRGETEALSEIEEFTSEIEYMCICPNPYEFLAAYESLSGAFEEYHPSESENLVRAVYSEAKRSEWLSDEDMTKSGKNLLPLCFFKVGRKILCLAWCGKRSGPITSFFERLKFFKNLKHIFICGICGCPCREVEVGSVFLSKKFINIKSFTMGGSFSAISKKKAIYLFGRSAYFTVPDFFSYVNKGTFLDDLIANLQIPGISIAPAINFSFECFIDDPVLAHQVEWRGEEEGATSIIDTEGAQFVALACQKYTVYSLRVVSDHTGIKIGEIVEGKQQALVVLKVVLRPSVELWMSYSGPTSKLMQEKRSPKPVPVESSPETHLASDRLSIIFYGPEGWFLRTISAKTLENVRKTESPRLPADASVPGQIESPKPPEVSELFGLCSLLRTPMSPRETSNSNG